MRLNHVFAVSIQCTTEISTSVDFTSMLLHFMIIFPQLNLYLVYMIRKFVCCLEFLHKELAGSRTLWTGSCGQDDLHELVVMEVVIDECESTEFISSCIHSEYGFINWCQTDRVTCEHLIKVLCSSWIRLKGEQQSVITHI